MNNDTELRQCSWLQPPIGYASFDLHYRDLADGEQWECVQYVNVNDYPSYFNVIDPDVGAVYGFSAVSPLDDDPWRA